MGGAPPGDPDLRPRHRVADRLRRLPPRAVRRALVLLVVLLAGCAAALLVDLPEVATLRQWLADAGPAGWAVLVSGLALATLAPVPRTALSVLAGVLAGFWGGLALAVSSGVLGAAAGFTLARLLGRETVTRLAGPRLARADTLLAERGFLAVLIGRLTPVVPFTVVSYAGGLSGMRLRDHLAGTAVGLLPGTVLHVTIGATVGDGEPSWLLGVLPMGLAVLVLAAVGLRHRRATTRHRAADHPGS